ncbi:MAG TPA: hypothetical protein VNW53_03705 [Phenylobacterium sp.]|jgi:hypothetical protein|uniref:hypothetical protein n=1 Tax=Phenylobacterium sp. TaxID=1871053 RepID=UPI002CE9DCEA|nr:hypothetical protein [Phenylobacterium sp.]HXA38080.1 hypothetical protein [Phenylobacterium sp.]
MRRAALIILLALAAVACQPAKVDPDAMTLTRAIYDEIRLGKDAALAAQAPAMFGSPQAAVQLARLRGVIPAGEPRSMKVVGQAVRDFPGKGRAEAVSLEYDYGASKTLFQTRLFRPAGVRDWRVAAFNLHVATARELAPNRLSPVGKSMLQYAYLALALASPLMMIAALVKVLRTPGLRHKWAWGLLCFVGLFGFQTNWATGQTLIVWNSVQFFGLWLSHAGSAFDPWFIKATVPAFALLILGGVLANPPRTRAQAPA